MEVLLGYLRDAFIQHGEAAAQSVAPLSVQLVLAILVFLTTRIMANRVRKSVGKGLSFAKADAHVALLLSNSAHVGVWCVGVLIILGVFGIGWTAVAAALGIVGIAITVSLQDVLKNFVAGVYILLERPFQIGDEVRIKEFTGIVEDVRLRTTYLRTEEGNQVIIPNATIFVEVLVNKGAGVAPEKVEQR